MYFRMRSLFKCTYTFKCVCVCIGLFMYFVFYNFGKNKISNVTRRVALANISTSCMAINHNHYARTWRVIGCYVLLIYSLCRQLNLKFYVSYGNQYILKQKQPIIYVEDASNDLLLEIDHKCT